MSQTRRRRSDRNHILYQITAPNGHTYVGLTVVEGTPAKSLRRRWLKHINRAANETHEWGLCEALRRWSSELFELEILERVRGRAAAYAREVELIRELKPKLNTAKAGKGAR
jgi:hypothetical protein